MIPASSGAGAILGLFLLLQVAAFLAIVFGGIYFLSCMGRSARALERLAEISEAQLMQNHQPPIVPGTASPAVNTPPVQIAPASAPPVSTVTAPTSIEVSNPSPSA